MNIKKTIAYLILVMIIIFITGCDKTYRSNLSITSANEILLSKTDEFIENSNNLSFNYSYFNHNHVVSFKDIDFKNEYIEYEVIKYSFFLKSTNEIDAKLSLKLNDANKYLLDYIRIALEIDNELIVHKYFERKEIVHDEANEYENTKHFISENDVFKEYNLPLNIDETKNVIIYVWIEQDELYDDNGNRLTGWKNHSYDINDIDLILSINN